MKRILFLILTSICLLSTVFAQSESLTNQQIVEMSQVGLNREIILNKIRQSISAFDVSTKALIELKKADIDDEIIALMLEKAKENASSKTAQEFSENQPSEAKQSEPTNLSPIKSLLSAKTIAIEKSSLHPSRQALEKSLFKRKEWKEYNLTIIRYKDQADLYIEIGRIPLTWITHRYVFRIYDRRNGVIITAGETTSWGSLAENMAREITQKLKTVSEK